MDWNECGEKWKNSLIQLTVTRANYNIERPYATPSDEIVYGTGFIIDIDKGYVATSANVVRNAIFISGRVYNLGRRNLKLTLKSICHEKNLALCKLEQEGVELVGRVVDNIKDLNMQFGDSMSVCQADQVMTIGYSVGKSGIGSIKYTTGIVSCFKSENSNGHINGHVNGNVEDARDRLPSYIQISAPLEIGNNGAPLLNKNGKVVGINADVDINNFGLVIPSRTFLAIYEEFSSHEIVKIPTLALGWANTNRDLMELKTGDPSIYGIYVTNVWEDSCLDKLQEGDIIKNLSYLDPFWSSNDNFKIPKPIPFDKMFDNKNNNKNKNLISVKCHFDRYGDCILFGEKDGESVDLCDRKLTISEVMDMVPKNSPLTFEICRNQEWFQFETIHNFIETDRILQRYPRIDPYEYEIFAGIVCVPMDYQHTTHFDSLIQYRLDQNNKYKRCLVIVQIFTDSMADKTKSLKIGDIITHVNGTDVKSINRLRKILSSSPPIITIKTLNNSFFMTTIDQAILDDQIAIKTFNVRDYKYLLSK